MKHLLKEIFDKTKRPVGLVSSYDGTVTYTNPAAARWADLPASQIIGTSAEEVLTRTQVLSDSPLLRCLRDPEHAPTHGQAPDGSWWLASAVPCADPSAPEIFASGHYTCDLEQAYAEHNVLCLRVAVAMEHSRCQRLLGAAAAAAGEAQRRLDFIGDLLADAGRRPINPANAPCVAL